MRESWAGMAAAFQGGESGLGSEDPLREWDWATRQAVITTCHAAFQRNPLANAIVQYTTDFVVGNGLNLVCKNHEVEWVLRRFMNSPDNPVREYERLLLQDLQVDGETLIRFFSEDGQTVMVPQRPWELMHITTEPGFFRRPVTYHFRRRVTAGDDPLGGQQTEEEAVPAEEMLHVAINRHGYELRGRPELTRILPWLKADVEWLSDRSRQSKWRGALLWHVKVARATTESISQVIGRWRKPPPPGSAYVSTDAETVTPLVNPPGAGDAGADGRAIRLMNLIGARLPEYFFGDGQHANLATATRQELPALTKFDAFQQIMLNQVWRPVFERVIENAITDGVLPIFVAVEDANRVEVTAPDGGQVLIHAREAFEISYEPVTSENPRDLAAMLEIAVKHGWASDQTAAERLGFDPGVERGRRG